MLCYDNYFQVHIYGENWSDLIETSKYVYQDKCLDVDVDDLVYVIYYFILDRNLDDVELFLRLAGFSAFTLEEMPNSITNPRVVNLNKNSKIVNIYGNIKTREDAIALIERYLGKGFVNYFFKVKENQICHQNIILREQIEKNNSLLQTRIRELRK